MPKITKRFLESFKRPDPMKEAFIWDAGDGAIKGFGVRIKPSGVASYFIQYRNVEGRTRRLVIGRVGILTPDEARAQAVLKLAAVASGADPSADRAAAKRAVRIADLCEQYLVESQGLIKASTLKVDRSRIEAHVKPLLGSRIAAHLTRADIEAFQRDIAAGKTARRQIVDGKIRNVTGGRGAAARTLGMLHAILEFGIRLGLLQTNPASGVRKFPDGKVTRYLSWEELGKLGAVLKSEQATHPVAVAAIKTLLLTGCRRNEILKLRLSGIDVYGRCFRLIDTKSGDQLRPVGKAALAGMKHGVPREGNSFAFPSLKNNAHLVGLPKILNRYCSMAGLQNVTIHTFRHTFAATAAELGYSELTIAGLLGHAVKGVTARYAHVPDRALVAAADAVADQIARALDGETAAVINMVGNLVHAR